MYLIHSGEALTTNVVGKIINAFMLQDLPRLQRWGNYYKGKQAILNKIPNDTGKPDNRIVVNYCNSIVENFQGYIAGIPLSYHNDTVDIQEILDILRYNDVAEEDSEWLKQALIYGKAYEICYIDEDKEQRFKTLPATECIPVYNADLTNELSYVIRFYSNKVYTNNVVAEDEYFVEIYSATDITVYKSFDGFSTFEFISQTPHYYGQVPITVFTLNKDETSIFDQVMSMQDAYNTIVSESINDYESFADAYMVIKGMTADDKDLEDMKQHRVLLLDNDASAEYLTKTFSDAQTQNLLNEINKKIHSISNSPDFTDEQFMAQSGIALRYKLVGFENRASAIEQQMRKAITKRIELISTILKLSDADTIWADINIQFTRNLPTDVTENVNVVTALQGIVSNETLLGLLPFVQDPQGEIEKVRAQKESNMELFDFNVSRNVDDDTEEEEEVDNEEVLV